MLAQRLIDKDVEPLTNSVTVGFALEKMQELNTNCLPLVNASNQVIGQFKKRYLESFESFQTRLSELEAEEPVVILSNRHIFEAIRLMLKFEIRVLPVVDDEQHYKGAICKKEVLEALTHLLNLSELGSIITIEMEQFDYTLSEIVQLIEREEAKILGIAVETPEGQGNKFRVSVKLNVQNTGNVAATLRRYGYMVTTETENDYSDIDFEERASELLNYLNM